MTPQQCKTQWNESFPEMVPVTHLLKYNFPDRWFRIHSLPDAKRSPETEEEWSILLQRQNTVATEMLGEGAKVFLVAELWEGEKNVPAFVQYALQVFDEVDLHKLDASYYDEGQVYSAAFAEVTWTYGGHDKLLRIIAGDEVRAFFVSFEKGVIVAPYDGGMDVIAKDTVMRDLYKEKYKEWLSEREDGM